MNKSGIEKINQEKEGREGGKKHPNEKDQEKKRGDLEEPQENWFCWNKEKIGVGEVYFETKNLYLR